MSRSRLGFNPSATPRILPCEPASRTLPREPCLALPRFAKPRFAKPLRATIRKI